MNDILKVIEDEPRSPRQRPIVLRFACRSARGHLASGCSMTPFELAQRDSRSTATRFPDVFLHDDGARSVVVSDAPWPVCKDFTAKERARLDAVVTDTSFIASPAIARVRRVLTDFQTEIYLEICARAIFAIERHGLPMDLKAKLTLCLETLSNGDMAGLAEGNPAYWSDIIRKLGREVRRHRLFASICVAANSIAPEEDATAALEPSAPLAASAELTEAPDGA